MDLNMLYGYVVDESARTMNELLQDIYEGKLLDPRDPKATKEDRLTFCKAIKEIYLERYDLDTPNDWTQEKADLYQDSLLLVAKIGSITPPQGYPNAPTYYIPEFLDELYQSGKLDKKLNPTIPAIFRESFPQQLLDKIEWYAKKHGIKE